MIALALAVALDAACPCPPPETSAHRVERLEAELEAARTQLRLDKAAAKVNAQAHRRKR